MDGVCVKRSLVKATSLAEAITCEFADRLEHRHPRLRPGCVHLADQALVDKAGQAIDGFDVDAVLISKAVDHGLDGGYVRLGEDAQHLEQQTLGRIEELVA